MVESSLVIVVLVLVGVWYFGGAINAVLTRSGDIADREFSILNREHAYSAKLRTSKIAEKVKKNKSKLNFDETELDAMLGIQPRKEED